MSEEQERAFSFGSVAEDYEATRPGWPREPFEEVLARYSVRDHPDIADIAAGTGKLTRTLAQLAGTLVAVEPDPSLREVIQRVLPEVGVFAGTAEELPLASESADVVTAGQAFHWFDVERGLTEIARVLRPGGVVIAAWNHRPKRAPGTTPDRLPGRRQSGSPAGAERDWAVDFTHPAYGELFETTPGTSRRAITTVRAPARHAQHHQPPAARAPARPDRGGRRGRRRAGRFDGDGHGIPWRCEVTRSRRRD